MTFHTGGSNVERMRIESGGGITLGGSGTNTTHTISSCRSNSTSGGAGTGNRLQLKYMEPNSPNFGEKILQLGVIGGGYTKMEFPGSGGLYMRSPYSDSDQLHLGYGGLQLDMLHGGYPQNFNMLIRSKNAIDFTSGGSVTAAMFLSSSRNLGIGTATPKSPKQRRIEVTPTTTVSSNAWSASTGSNGGYDVKNDDTSAHAALGAITCAGVYNKQAVEWSLRGNMTANTWYPIATMGQLTNWQDETGNGINDGFSMYFRIYAYDVGAGGPTYLSNAMTERIWVNGYTSNSNQEHRIHVGPWMGHAPNHSPTIYDDDQHYQMRIHHHYSQSAGDSVYTAQPTIEILVKTARTGLTGASSNILNVYGYIG
jgi:hypothetical protein